MKPLSRRTITAGALAAVTAIPAVGLSLGLASNARARIDYHTRELEKAMRDLYGDAETLTFGPTKGMRPLIAVFGQKGRQDKPPQI